MPNHLSQQSDVLETTQFGGHPVDVLNRMCGDGYHPQEYTITSGAEPESTNVSLILPHTEGLERQPWNDTPENRLLLVKSVEGVRNIAATARHHINIVLNGRHPEAHLLTDIVMRLGGHVSRMPRGITLRLTENVDTIDQLYAFISATPGLTQGLRVNPVYESMARREDVNDLVPNRRMEQERGEQRTLRVTGDMHGSPDIHVINHLESEGKCVRIVSLSRKPTYPGSDQFEMIIVLQATRDPRVLDTLPAALVSDHAGVYGAQPVAPDHIQQFVQIVTPDHTNARDLVRSAKGLQTRYRRMDGRPVVTGSMPPHQLAQLQKTLSDARLPHKVNVPLMQDSLSFPPSSHNAQWHEEIGDGYHNNMRRLLTDLLEEGSEQ